MLFIFFFLGIFAYVGQVAGEEMLMFNLSGLSRSEEIGSVELHFYKRRAVSRKKVGQKMHHHHLLGFALGGDSSVDADDYSSDADDMNDDMKNPQQIGKWEVALDKRGWQVYDVSAALAGRKLLVQQLGFKFQGVRRSSGRYESLSLESVLRMEPSPFLVVFSNERSNATLQETGIVSQGDVNALPDGQDDDTAVDDSNNNNRKRRSIEDNELPEADHHFNNNNVIPQTSPGVLQGRGSSSSASGRPSSGASSAGSRKSGTLPYPKSHHDRTTTTTTDSSMLAWPEDKRKGGGGGGGGSRAGGNNGRKGKRRNRKLPETWHYNQQVEYNLFIYKQTQKPISELERKRDTRSYKKKKRKRDSTRPFSLLSDRSISPFGLLLFHQLLLCCLLKGGTILYQPSKQLRNSSNHVNIQRDRQYKILTQNEQEREDVVVFKRIQAAE